MILTRSQNSGRYCLEKKSECDDGYIVCEITDDLLACVTPANATYKPILIVRCEMCLKAALQNTSNGRISLITSTNVEATERTIKSKNPDWQIDRSQMSAPLSFWKELAVRL